MVLVAVCALWLVFRAVCLIVVASASFASGVMSACYADVVESSASVTLQRPWCCRLDGGAHIGQVDVFGERASCKGEEEGVATSVGFEDLL